jgi:hypothetical protein
MFCSSHYSAALYLKNQKLNIPINFPLPAPKERYGKLSKQN